MLRLFKPWSIETTEQHSRAHTTQSGRHPSLSIIDMIINPLVIREAEGFTLRALHCEFNTEDLTLRLCVSSCVSPKCSAK